MADMNYQLEMEQVLRRVPKGQPLLLHACCGPCATVALQRLGGHFRLVVYYYNPNIWPLEEHTRRAEALRHLVGSMPLAYPAELVEAPYAPETFAAAAAGLEGQPEGGARCAACFGLRLTAAAQKAAALGIGWLATTLTTGPRKDAAVINPIGRRAAEAAGLMYLPADFKKKDGYRQSVALAGEYGLYRQHYCGCRFAAGGK